MMPPQRTEAHVGPFALGATWTIGCQGEEHFWGWGGQGGPLDGLHELQARHKWDGLNSFCSPLTLSLMSPWSAYGHKVQGQ